MTTTPIQSNSSASSDTNVTQDIYLGIDSGNGRLKALSSNGYSVRIPSLLYFPHSEISVGELDNESSHIVYAGGSRSDLWGKQWVVGREAYIMAPDTHISTADDKEAKAKYCLELLLGAAAQVVKSEKVELTTAVSIHDKGSFKDEVIAKLEGTHRVGLNNFECQLTVKVKSVVDEGVGAYYELLSTGKVKKSNTALFLDIGHGTIIISVFGNGELKFRKAYPLGVAKLYGAIANNLQMRKALKGIPGNPELIKAGIERGDFIYGNNPRLSFNFADIYKAELRPWVSDSLAKVLAATQQWQNEATHLFCIGGGVNLPGIKPALEKKAFECLENSEWLNAKGLLKIAQRNK
ncbi:MAG: ParM/StbA family protein [Microcoleaceae cyanobacterium MO_207.B10]|nr:ParM/StbA family protein [Microcoleaceae cyanobacterium MO_207.B10]